MSGPWVLFDAQDVAYTAATDTLGGGPLTLPSLAHKARLTIAVSAAVKLRVKVNGSSNACVFNTDANLTAGAVHRFDFDAQAGKTLAFTLSGDCTVYHIHIKGICEEQS